MSTKRNFINTPLKLDLNRAVHFSTVGEKSNIPLHQHYDYELIYNLNGYYKCTLNNDFYEVAPNEAILLRPGDWHSDFINDNVHYYAVNFTHCDRETEKFTAELFRESAKTLIIDDPSTILQHLIEQIVDETGKDDLFSCHIQAALLSEIFWYFLRLLPESCLQKEFLENDEKSNFERKLDQLFQANINRNLSLEKMAASLYITPRTLNNHCLKHLKTSPVKAFTKFKVEHAMSMLKHTDMSIKEISDYLGFANPYHFSKVFKRIYKFAPAFIKRNR